MSETRKIAAILAADIVGYSRLMGVKEEATLARLRALRNGLFNPTIEAHGGRVVSRAGDGAIIELRSVVEAVRCAPRLNSANSSIGCAASHVRSKCASNFAAVAASRITTIWLSCARSPLGRKFAERRKKLCPSNKPPSTGAMLPVTFSSVRSPTLSERIMNCCEGTVEPSAIRYF